ncbi:FAD binding domain protein [Aspergillus parasiticus SU-1]|uniref:FAD binding domain protein n=1 Tax=Aspergillus parasiticus (strain ATCC 56775 / NRRL 5862 / SRRC 143 / SU-1) TaxID=1403190 RepID=A0A0F0I3Y1_ASPPU|nr:FAD binding domain protein [Aspergillus parasiticus SU-1]
MSKKQLSLALTCALSFSTARAIAFRDNLTLPVSLQQCLNNSGTTMVYPSDLNYDALSRPQNANYQPHPKVIVIPTSSEEVAASVRCVAAEKGEVKLSTRGGGHSYAAYGVSGEVVVDSSQMKKISFDDDKKEVTVQFGQTLGPLAVAMGRKGYALPHGTCPGVGIAGHSLGGGWGFTSRKWGWLVDHIVSLEFVDVEGNIKLLSSSSAGMDAELWWALRGAGANNFGIVTSFTYATEAAPAAVVNYGISFSSKSDCAQVLLAVQELGSISADDPDGLPVELGGEVIISGADATNFCSFTGQYLGERTTFLPVLDRLLGNLADRGVKPANSTSYIKEFDDWIDALTDLMGSLDEPSTPQPYYAQSLVDDGAPNYTSHRVENIIDAIQNAKLVKDTDNHVSFDLNGPGSRTNIRPTSGDTSFIHRDGLFLVQIFSYKFPGFNNTDGRDQGLEKITNIADTIKQAKPSGQWHAYQNYIDPYLDDFGQAYYGVNLERLKSLKAFADPDMVFDFPQGLGHA